MDFLVYLFGIGVSGDFAYYLEVLFFAAFLVVFSVFVSIYSRKQKAFKKVFKGVGENFFSVAVILLILLGARYTEIPFISMRFLLFAALSVGFYLIGKFFHIYFKVYKGELALRSVKKDQPKKQLYSHAKKKK